MNFSVHGNMITCNKKQVYHIEQDNMLIECDSCSLKCKIKIINNRIYYDFNLVNLKCSFCGKSQDDVYKLVVGPGINICNECINLCVGIIDEEEEKDDKILIEDIKSYTC